MGRLEWAEAGLGNVFLWAQAQGGVVGEDVATVSRSALRRWFAGLTLSGPEPLPSAMGWWALFAGLGLLLLAALAVQGPLRAIRQILDVGGHVRLVLASLRRFRRAGRLVAVLFGATVLSWTSWQGRLHAAPERLEELVILHKTKSVGEMAVEQAGLAGLTPLRDLLGLGDVLVLLLGASVIVFRRSADRWSLTGSAAVSDRLPSWTTPTWGCAWIYLVYRLACLIWEPTGQPLSLTVWIEMGVVPLAMLVSDAILFAWVLTEARQAFSDAADEQIGLNVSEALWLVPSALTVCMLVMPARWVAVTLRLVLPYVGGDVASLVIAPVLLGWGLVWIQAAAVPFVPLCGAAAWGNGRGGMGRVYWRMLRASGGRLVAVVAGSCLAAALVSWIAYEAVLRLPAQPWVLTAADSYSHYATLPVGLLLVVTLVELADAASRGADAGVSGKAEGVDAELAADVSGAAAEAAR